MQKEMQKITLEDFARLFGTRVENIPEKCRVLISRADFSYRKLDEDERKKVMREVSEFIETGKLSVVGKEKQPRWDEGWKEILENFIRSNYDLSQLTPQYVKPARFMRLDLEYIVPTDPMFEMKWLDIFRIWLFGEYFANAENIYEFGCGTGRNLITLAKLFPEKQLYGLEWVAAPLEIIRLLEEKTQF